MKMQNCVGLYMALANQLAPKIGKTVDQAMLREEAQRFADIARTAAMNGKFESGRSFLDYMMIQLFAGKIEGYVVPEGITRAMMEKFFDDLLADHPNIWGCACRELGLSAS